MKHVKSAHGSYGQHEAVLRLENNYGEAIAMTNDPHDALEGAQN